MMRRTSCPPAGTTRAIAGTRSGPFCVREASAVPWHLWAMLVQMRAGAMTSRKPDWISKEGVAVGKGATAQEFVATDVDVKLEIDVAPWGEGHLRINGREVGDITSAKDRRQAFRDLKQMAEHYLQLRPPRAKGAQA
jgi:hypothetical protein